MVKRTPKAKPVPARVAPAEPEAAPTVHHGWGHDWRNPDAVFAAEDHCANADMARLARR